MVVILLNDLYASKMKITTLFEAMLQISLDTVKFKQIKSFKSTWYLTRSIPVQFINSSFKVQLQERKDYIGLRKIDLFLKFNR